MLRNRTDHSLRSLKNLGFTSIYTYLYNSLLLHYVSKNVTTLSCYNFDIHKLISMIFGRSVTEEVINQKTHYFPTSLNLCFCVSWGNRKHGNCLVSLKCCTRFCQQTQNTTEYHLSQLNHPSLSK